MIRHTRNCDVCEREIEAIPDDIMDVARDAATLLVLAGLSFTGPRDLCADCTEALATALRRTITERRPGRAKVGNGNGGH